MTPTGFEHSPKTQAFRHDTDPVPPPVPPSLPITCDPGLIELAEIWEAIDPEARADLLAVARGLAAESKRLLKTPGG